MHILFEYLENKGLSNDDDMKSLNKWNNAKLIEFIDQLDSLNFTENENKKSLFSFSVNEELSSGKNSCSRIECRLKKMKELAQFAVLYSENVLIYNPFENYFGVEKWTKFYKSELINDLIIINYLKPLINKGIIKFTPGKDCLCEDCRSKILSKFENLLESIESNIIETTKFTIANYGKKCSISIRGNSEIFGHELSAIIIEGPFKYAKFLKENDGHILTTEEIKMLGLSRQRAEEIVFDLTRQDANVKIFNNNYLFANDYYPEIINKINNFKTGSISHREIVNGLTHVVPTIENTNLHNLISLRENDYESFLVYRDSITKLIKQTIENKDFSDLETAINDIVKPELNKINLTISKNRKLLTYKTSKELFIGSGLIALGVFSGILPPDFGKIFGAIGGCAFAQAIANQLIDLNNPEYNILDNNYYFIWKMQQMTKQ